MSTTDDGLLTAEQMAEVLKVEPVTVNRMANRGEIPFVQVGPKFKRFDRDEVIAALRRQQQEGTATDGANTSTDRQS